MPNRLPPTRGYNLSDVQLGRGMLNSPLRDFLRNYAKRDRVGEFMDFVDWGDAANFSVAQTQTSVSFTVVDGLGGVMAGTAVGASTASISAIGKTRFAGNNNCMMEVRWKVDTIAASYIGEFGFVNAVGTTGASAVVDIDTPSFFTNVTNAAVFGIWTNQTHANLAFATLGSFTSQTVASTLLTTSNSAITAPAVDTYITTTVLLLTDPDETAKSKAYAWVNGRLVAKHEAAAGAINGQAAVYPYVYLQGITTVARIMTVDYVYVTQDRAALGAALE
jgi:hypothetical protein